MPTPYLPAEVRLQIWEWTLELEKKDRIMEWIALGMMRPTESLLSSLLEVSRESPSLVLRRYPNALEVYRGERRLPLRWF